MRSRDWLSVSKFIDEQGHDEICDVLRHRMLGRGTGAANDLIRVESYLFSAKHQWLLLGNPESLSMVASFTVSLWLRVHSFGSQDRAILCQDVVKERDMLHIVIRRRRVYFGFYFSDTTGSQFLSSGRWYHLACVYDAASGKQFIFVDGALDAESGGHLPLTNSNPLYVSKFVSAENGLNGELASLRIIPRSIGPEAVVDLMKAAPSAEEDPPALKTWWRHRQALIPAPWADPRAVS